MSRVQLDLPPSVLKDIRALARRDGVSAKELMVSAVSEKAASLHALEYLRMRAARGSRERFLDVLARVPNRPPMKGDELPPELAEKLARRRAARRPRAS